MRLRRLAAWLPFLLLAAVIGLRVAAQDRFEDISLRVFDQFQRIKPRPYHQLPVLFVDIDDESLRRHGQWPWPRTQTADLIARLHRAGAAVITLDIVFAEPDRTSPANLLKLWAGRPEAESLRAGLSRMPDHDALLAKTMSEVKAVTGFILINDQKTGTPPPRKAGMAHAGADPLQYFQRFAGAVINLPEIGEAAAGNGSFNFLAEKDGIIRRVPLIFRYQDVLYPSLAAETVRVMQGASSMILKTAGASGETGFGEETGMVSVKIGNLIIPTDSRGRIWLYDTGPVPARVLPAWQVLDDAFDAARVRDKIVFVGASAGGLKDLRATPLNPVAAGTEIHVQLTEQMLLGESLNRPDWAVGAEITYLFVLSLFLILLLPRTGALPSAIVGLAAIAAAFGFSWHAYDRWRLLLDPVFSSAAAVMIYFVVSLTNYLRTEQEKKEVRTAFSRYLAPAMVKELADHPERLELGGVERDMTVLFADIRGFTSLSEKMSAGELAHFMNKYLTAMTTVILKEHGTIDKYIGDCIMAFWNAPIELAGHARHACAAALAMQKALAEWNASGGSTVKTGIGLNTGHCSVGNMGSDQRFDYTVLGDEVNLASRLEGQCKVFETDIITGEKTRTDAADFAFLELDLIRVHGRNAPSKIFALLGGPEMRTNPVFEKLSARQAAFLTAYRKGAFKEAEKIAEEGKSQLAPHLHLEGLYNLYLARLKKLQENPPAGWQGVWEASGK